MNKQTFTIPEGCKAVTVEQVGNQIITTFEPAFKRGDVLITKKTHSIYDSILVYGSHDGASIIPIVGIYGGVVIFGGVCAAKYRHATPEEAQRLWDALAKEGKRWNPETMQVEPIKRKVPRARNEIYYYITGTLNIAVDSDIDHSIDCERHISGNYFCNKEQAQRASDLLKAELDKFWERELK